MRLSIFFALLLTSFEGVATDVQSMDRLVQAQVDAGQFMGAVLVAEGERIIFSKAYGKANLEWNIPNDVDTRFRIGSITKQFTAAAILLLEQKGKLHTSDPIKKHLPNSPATWDAITIHHLATNTSGIPDYQKLPTYDPYEDLRPAKPEQLLSTLRKWPLGFTPGTQHEYSNSNFELLGYIVAKVAAQPYVAFVTDNILRPLGMKNSGFYTFHQVLPHRASGYEPSPDGLKNGDILDMSNINAAGGLYSTVGDLHRWQLGLYAGKLLSAEQLRKMTTPAEGGYAYGLRVQQMEQGIVYYHPGQTDGFEAMLGYWPDTRVTTVVLGNLNGSAVPLSVDLAKLAQSEALKRRAADAQQRVPADGPHAARSARR